MRRLISDTSDVLISRGERKRCSLEVGNLVIRNPKTLVFSENLTLRDL